jgi:chloramphenicol-sensitive protein RarD
MLQKNNNVTIGIWYGVIAYLAWGILPLYWKAIDQVQALEILAHRILWSFVFVFLLLIVSKKVSLLQEEIVQLMKRPVAIIIILLSAVLISANWFVYIWAVNHNHIIEASLGYYINPLVSVALGIFVLKEKLTSWQVVSFFLAFIGVLLMTFHYGTIPWVALILASSFGLYGLTKKLTKLGALTGLFLETLLMTPIALIYVIYLSSNSQNHFVSGGTIQMLILIGAGIVTALPLLWFAEGAKRIPLSMIGFLQYIAPTISLLLGVFLYKETFTITHLISFLFIWAALVIFSLSQTSWLPQVGWRKRKGKPLGL